MLRCHSFFQLVEIYGVVRGASGVLALMLDGGRCLCLGLLGLAGSAGLMKAVVVTPHFSNAVYTSINHVICVT
jgi:hypothetical protein